MAYVNRVTVLGNLGADPDLRKFPDGTAVAVVSVATTESWRDKTTDVKKEHTEWHRVVFYRGLAEVVGKYLKKGAAVYVEGKLRTRTWDDNGQTRYVTEIVASTMQMLDRRSDKSGAESSAGAPSDAVQSNAPVSAPLATDSDNDYPF